MLIDANVIKLCISTGAIIFAIIISILGWGNIERYSPKVRTIIFWIMDIMAGILALHFLIVMGTDIPWGRIGCCLAALGGILWVAEDNPRHMDAHIRRRGIISAREDALLFLDALIITIGVPAEVVFFLWG